MTILPPDQAARLADCTAEDWPRYLQATVLAEVRALKDRQDSDAEHARWLLGHAFLAACRREGPLAAACLRQAVRTLVQAESDLALPLAA